MKIGIIGAGNIGKAIQKLLSSKADLEIELADQKAPGTTELNVFDTNGLKKFLSDKTLVINAGPHYINQELAYRAGEANVAYFDLSEDVESTTYIDTLVDLFPNAFFMPQCGLAPGAINIIANGLTKSFDKIKTLDLKVGALPINPKNHMKYNLSWSTDGLIREYSKPANAIQNGETVRISPLGDLDQLVIDGQPYESFSTSGGVASLHKKFKGRVQNLSYKTIRYPGHCRFMKFLFEDLDFQSHPDDLVKIFNQAVPYCDQDVVLIFVRVVGEINGRLVEKNYVKKVYHDDQLSAIQITTASGICAAVDLFLAGKLPTKGIVQQDTINLEDFWSNQFGSIYQL